MATINKLNNSNYQPTMEVLKKEPNYNLFFIGDIEIYGCESETVEVWNQVENDNIVGALCRYNSSVLVYYIDENQDKEPFAEIIKSIEYVEIVSGKPQYLTEFTMLFPKSIVKDMFFCELTKDIDIDKFDVSKVAKAMPSDAKKLCDLRNSIVEFSTKTYPEKVADAIEKKFSRYYCIFDGEEIVSTAATTAENSVSAMIVGVCTNKNYRNKGYVTSIMAKLCYDVQQEKKSLCLFYDNPDAGSIYHNLGFETIGKWAMIQTNMDK